MSTVAAIHRSNYVPWPGFFHKLAAADVFVYLDAVQYPRGRNLAARNRIRTPSGVALLTVPVTGPKDTAVNEPNGEVRLSDLEARLGGPR